MGFFRRVWRSITDISFLRYDILFQRAGRSVGYLVLLVTLTFALSAVRGYGEFTALYRQLERDLATEMPGFRLAGGILHWEGPQPHIVQSPQGGFIIDTTGAITPEDLGPFWQGIFLQRDRLWIRQGAQDEVIRYGDLNLEISKEQILGWLPYLRPLAVLVGVIAYGWTVAAKLLSTTFAACLVALLAGAKKQPLRFFAAWNLAAHAVTLPLLATWVGGQLGWRLPFVGQLLVYYGPVLVYAHLVLQRLAAGSDAVLPPPAAGI